MHQFTSWIHQCDQNSNWKTTMWITRILQIWETTDANHLKAYRPKPTPINLWDNKYWSSLLWVLFLLVKRNTGQTWSKISSVQFVVETEINLQRNWLEMYFQCITFTSINTLWLKSHLSGQDFLRKKSSTIFFFYKTRLLLCFFNKTWGARCWKVCNAYSIISRCFLPTKTIK